MRQYETMVIIDAMIADAAIEQELAKIEKKIAEAGEIIKTDHWGKRKMAYDIQKKSHGFYALFFYNAEASVVDAMEKDFRINENVLRWMTLVDQPMPAEKPAEEVEEEQAEAAEEN